MAEYKRKRYLIKKAFQLKYTGIILLFILFTVFLASFTTYYAIFPYLSEKLASVYPQNRLISILANANLKLFYNSSIPIILAIWIGIMLSHKVAGPWYRLENMLLDMAKGTATDGIKLRKGDELQSLAEAINKVTARIRIDKDNTLRQLDVLQQDLAKLREEVNNPQPNFVLVKQATSKAQDSLNKLKNVIS